MSEHRIPLTDLKNPSIRTLHFTWFAFFLTFVVWFNHAPMLAFMKEAFDLSSQQVKALMILNVAMTIPASMIVTFLMLYLAGFTLNVISLMAMALSNLSRTLLAVR